MISIRRRFTFEAAHALDRLPETHRCARLHGHTYRLEVTVTGTVDPVSGWILDFADLDKFVHAKVLERLDHRFLNDVIEQPTAERVCAWIASELRQHPWLKIEEVVLWETDRGAAVWRCAST